MRGIEAQKPMRSTVSGTLLNLEDSIPEVVETLRSVYVCLHGFWIGRFGMKICYCLVKAFPLLSTFFL